MDPWSDIDILNWSLILAPAALPFVLSAVMLVLTQLRQHRRPRGQPLAIPAGEWLQAKVARLAPGVGVQLHNQEGLDAYFPGVHAIGLSERTWNGHHIEERTVAAHELGHALQIRESVALSHALPVARLINTGGWRISVAALWTGAGFGVDWAVDLAWVCALLTLLAGAVVLADEGGASQRAYRILSADLSIPTPDLRRASDALRAAFSLYASTWVGQVLVVLGWPLIGSAALSGTGISLTGAVSAPALWLLFFMMPFFLLRAAHILVQIWRPEPVRSEFRLFTVMQREAQWEFLTGFSVLILIGALYDHGTGPLFTASMILALMTALGPLGAVGRALVLFPLLLLLRRVTPRQQADDEALFPETRPEGAAPALMSLYDAPPWYLRMSWASHLAYLPLVFVLVAQLAF